jgi:hypothetical protein
MKRLASISQCVLLLCASGEPLLAQPEVRLSLRYTGSFDADDNFLGMPLNNPVGPSNSVDPTDVHAFAVDLEVFGVSSVRPEEDIRGVGFDAVLGPNLQPEIFEEAGGPGAYFGTPAVYSPPGPDPPVDAWSTNRDGGASPLDLIEIVVDSNFHNPAIVVLQPGETGPFELGRFYVNLLETTTETFVNLAPNSSSPWSIWESGTSVPQPASTFFVGEPFVIRVVPEPAGFGMLFWTAAWLAMRRTGIRPRE